MKTSLILALLVAFAAPAVAAAKTGDLYVNADGSCDKGDKKNGYWCVESLKVAGPAGPKAKLPNAPAVKRIYPKAGKSFTEKPMP